MLTMPFLTDLDSRATIKGSRDPLGIQQIWTRFGRHVVGNLTTVTTSVRDFTTLLLGYYFAEQVARDLGAGSELATFLKWEQLAAYSRFFVNKDDRFRGTERVKKNLSSGSRITLSADPADQILGNQKIYGLWGLYTGPARTSYLVEGDPTRLTPAAFEHVESVYLPLLTNAGAAVPRRICDALAQRATRIDLAKGGAQMAKAVGRVLQRDLLAKDREFFQFHLRDGGPLDTEKATNERQSQLAQLLENTLDQEDFQWSPAAVANLVKSARAKGEGWHPLADRLQRIRTCEAVLAPVSALFIHLLGLNGKPVDGVIDRLRTAWGNAVRSVDVSEFRELRAEIDLPDIEHVIHYDLPMNPEVLERRRGRFDRFGRMVPCTMYLLRDESGAIPNEAKWLDAIRQRDCN